MRTVPFSSKKHGKGDNATFVIHPESHISKLSLFLPTHNFPSPFMLEF
jgi:hypothetical protein